MRSYNEVLVTEGKSDVRTVYAVPQFTIPDDKLLVIELFEKDGGRHQPSGWRTPTSWRQNRLTN